MAGKIPYELLTKYFIDANRINEDIEYKIYDIMAEKLIVPERIDLMAKLIYIDAYINKRDMTEARNIYTKHIEAFSEGTYTEPGSEEKNSIEIYYKCFDLMIESFKDGGFDINKSIVPIGKNNILLDGSHRSACAIYFKKTVRVIEFPSLTRNYNFNFFRNRLLDDSIIEKLIIEYCKYKPNTYFACIWPRAYDKKLRQKALQILKNKVKIVFTQDAYLNYRGLVNFMMQIYSHQNWIGTYKNEHWGVKDKANRCWKYKKSTLCIVFECNSLEEVNKLKARIRDIFQLENDSIHISDNIYETRRMNDLIFNKHSKLFLNTGFPDKFKNFNLILDYISQNTNHQNICQNLIINEGVLGLYGIKDVNKLIVLNNNRKDCYELYNDKITHNSIGLRNSELPSDNDIFIFSNFRFRGIYLLLKKEWDSKNLFQRINVIYILAILFYRGGVKLNPSKSLLIIKRWLRNKRHKQ